MKKLIFTLAIITSTIFSVNAAELDLLDTQLFNNNTTIINKDPEKKKVVKTKIYQWTVKTSTGVFTGTADNLEAANNQIASLTQSSTILQKEISSIYLNNAKNTDRIYTWGVVTDRGFATGVATSLDQANKMVKLMGNTEVAKSKIIESFKSTK
ncbi:hypothetical protein [Olleya marilimosa]|uniref:hypothetical protein n=1 Tax=Olleya marilimosa TaxID=272164 RepID=UPI000485509B|nr:hypothetical protein [Olleya marilimosa]